jgi:uroporphyrin-III C-methyltransferase/precorrin-2 dehydrogenase/sirohydrochlorin ferrochelatase
MKHLPVFLSVHGRSGLVVGGGAAAADKARLLRQAGAAVTVVAPKVAPALADLAAGGEIRLLRRRFVAGDVAGRVVVYGATGNDAVDVAVAKAASAAGVPVNVIDRPRLSSFISPAIVDRDPVMVAISTGGAAPVLARRLRAAVESLLPSGLGRLAQFAESFRAAVKANFPTAVARRRFWDRFFDGPIAEAVLGGDLRGAREAMLNLVNRPGADRWPTGGVTLVGAGPGDPDLLTFRALRSMQQADLVVYDRLVGADILDYARRDAERVYVGKAKGGHGHGQEWINALMVREAKAGKRVVRLKGGDPFIFGRGGEELDYLRRHGVPVEVVPGVTAAAGRAAAAGLPLIHRDHAPAITFISGHGISGHGISGHGKDGGLPDLDWAALARARHTLVIYLGRSTAGSIAGRLIDHGMAPTMPAAIIENGTRPEQKVAGGDVAGLEHMIAAAGISGPALIVIGEVARMADAAALSGEAEAPATRRRRLA